MKTYFLMTADGAAFGIVRADTSMDAIVTYPLSTLPLGCKLTKRDGRRTTELARLELWPGQSPGWSLTRQAT
jgi:hypothetical protein